MKHEMRGWGLPACVCGYQPGGMDKTHTRKMLDLHFRARHDLHEHLQIINQLVAPVAAQPNQNQDMALAILHIAECLEQIRNDCWIDND